jgi:hypothetical protein
MMTKKITRLPNEKYSGMKFFLEKIIWHVNLNMMANEITRLPCEKYSGMKFFLEKNI